MNNRKDETASDIIESCAVSSIQPNTSFFLLTQDALSDKPFVKAASEELGALESISDWLTSGTNSFCKVMGQSGVSQPAK